MQDSPLLVFKPCVVFEPPLILEFRTLKVSSYFLQTLLLKHFVNFTSHSGCFFVLVHFEAIQLRVCGKLGKQLQLVVILVYQRNSSSFLDLEIFRPDIILCKIHVIC